MRNRGLGLYGTVLFFLICTFIPSDLLAQRDNPVPCCYNQGDQNLVATELSQTILRNRELNLILAKISRKRATAVRMELLSATALEALGERGLSSFPFEKGNEPGFVLQILESSSRSLPARIPNKAQ
jgi:hypothetical protein